MWHLLISQGDQSRAQSVTPGFSSSRQRSDARTGKLMWMTIRPVLIALCVRYLTLGKGPPPDKANIYGIGANAASEISTERLAAFVRETFAEAGT